MEVLNSLKELHDEIAQPMTRLRVVRCRSKDPCPREQVWSRLSAGDAIII